MRIEYAIQPQAARDAAPDAAMTIGVFDGAHVGHQRVARRVAEVARTHGMQAVAVTFWPHPLSVLRPEAAPALLTSLEERLALLGRITLDGRPALDATLVAPFTEELAALGPDAFLDWLGAFATPRALVEGPDFALGHGRAGDMAWLRAAGERRGFTVETQEALVGGARVSSSRARALLAQGQVEAVTELLGRSYRLTGVVVPGDKRGRLLGFPTANLRFDTPLALPATGVYAIRVWLPGERDDAMGWPGVCNIGVRPTFGGEPRLLVEAHLLDAAFDLYGLTLRVRFVARLRDERRFAGVEELKAQISADVAQARALLRAEATAQGAAQATEM